MADSIWYYKNRGEFKQFIRTQADKSIPVFVMLAGFREITVLPKRLGQLVVQQISDEPKHIEQIFKALRRMPPESKYKLPYNKEERQQEIIDSIAKVFPIDRENAHCKIVTGCYKDDKTGQQFPYAVELAIAPRSDLDSDNAGQMNFIGSVNDTPAIDGGGRYFQSDQYAYSWTDRSGTHTKNSAREVLAQSGFNEYWGTSRRRVPSVVYINVKTNVPNWLGAAGKTHINQIPYGGTIAKNLSIMAHKIPSYRGQGYSEVYEPSSSSYQKSATDYLDDFLKERRQEVEADSSLRQWDGITQRTAIYRIRPKMEKEGFEPRKNWGTTCKSLANSIGERCQELWPDENITREDLGIYAKARGMMYYQGQTYPIDFESIDELASKAPINIVIEKEGVPRVLKPYADKYSIALINTQGRFTKYVIKFIEKALDNGSVVVTIVDDDVTGDDIAKSTDATKIGIFRKETLEWLKENVYPGLDINDILEGYYPHNPHIRELRAEIDAIIAVKEIGAAGLWQYILDKLQSKEIAPEDGYDLNELVSFPANELLYPTEIADSYSTLNEYIDEITREKRKEIERDLTGATELPEIESKNQEIDEILSSEVAEDGGVHHAVRVLTELRQYLLIRMGRRSQ